MTTAERLALHYTAWSAIYRGASRVLRQQGLPEESLRAWIVADKFELRRRQAVSR